MGHSQYFADVLVREPPLFRWLTSSGALASPLSSGSLRPEIDRIFATFEAGEKRLDALKRLHRRELLRIGAQDILGTADLPSATEQLSVLAAEVLDAALRIAVDQTGDPEEGRPHEAFCVIGLGKFGGNELNYSSDIDIMFVYDDGPGGVEIEDPAVHAYFNRLTGRLIRNLSQHSAEGRLYRVDARLRPNAGAGPLALSVEAFLAHYESRGELWERQMLIKARPVAGDRPFGAEFLRKLEPFVYPRTLTEHPASAVARIKSRIEAEVADEPNIKLMAGGIRDIEFVAQTLQLISGGALPAVRQTNTLRALAVLEEHRLLARQEHETLRGAYTLFRTIEHRLQMTLNTQTHTIPRDARAFEVLARRAGFPGSPGLRRAIDTNLAAVRSIFEQVLGAGGAAAPRRGIQGMIAGDPDERSVAREAGTMGFRDARGAAHNIRLLARGGTPAGMPGQDVRARETLASAAPALFGAIMATPDPDFTLGSLTLLASSQKLPHLFYTQLADPGYRKFILTVCASSPRIARELGRQPLLLELISSEQEGFAFPTPLPAPDPLDVAAFKIRHELMAGVRHLLGLTDFDGLTGEISSVASAVVVASSAAAARKGKNRIPPLAVFALGKFGTGELGFDADIDLLFVAGDAGRSALPSLEKTAARILAGVSVSAAGERLYEADVRLRPEGKSAPLVVEAGSYAKYLASRASLWERQSLTRLRFVAGERFLGEYVSALVSSWVYDAPLPEGWGETIVAMRRAMESRTRAHRVHSIDLKLGPGGMADIEFIVQMIQLSYGGTKPEIRGRKVGALLTQGWLPPGLPGDPSFLASAYAMYRRLELLLRISLEERGWVLPEGEKLRRLALLYDGSPGGSLEARVISTMNRVREEFLGIAAFLERARPGVHGQGRRVPHA